MRHVITNTADNLLTVCLNLKVEGVLFDWLQVDLGPKESNNLFPCLYFFRLDRIRKINSTNSKVSMYLNQSMKNLHSVQYTEV